MSWSPEQLAFVRLWTAAMLAFGKTALPRGTVSDVVAWTDPDARKYVSLRVALVGDGLKVARAFGYTGVEGGEEMNLGAQPGPISYAAARLLRAKRMSLDIGRDKVSLPDLLDRISGQAAHEFCDAIGIELPFDETSTRLIIEPGYPWPENDAQGLVYWSAKKEKLVHPERPAWLIEVEDRSGGQDGKMRLGVNSCLVFPSEPKERSWPLWARSGKQDLIVAHSMTLLPTPDAPAFPFLGQKFHKQIDTAIEGIRSCGGLLFPSLSIGEIPASNFGPITLVGHMGLVLDGLKPFKIRGEDASSWVYENDAWTVSTGELMRDVAARLFDELHGHEDFMYGHHIWSLGPPSEWFGGPTEGSTPLKTSKDLVKAAKRRGSKFKRGMTLQQFSSVNESVAGTPDKYAYCEAKARTVVSLDDFPVLVGPDTLKKQIQTFVRGVGYKGEVVLLPDTLGVVEHDMSDDRDYVLFQWSWLVADAIKKMSAPMELP